MDKQEKCKKQLEKTCKYRIMKKDKFCSAKVIPATSIYHNHCFINGLASPLHHWNLQTSNWTKHQVWRYLCWHFQDFFGGSSVTLLHFSYFQKTLQSKPCPQSHNISQGVWNFLTMWLCVWPYENSIYFQYCHPHRNTWDFNVHSKTPSDQTQNK